MNTPRLPRRIIGAPAVGQKAAFSRTVTEADVSLFIGVTWDVNPLHTDATYVAGTRFQSLIAPGLLTASMMTHLGGLWAFLATEMTFEFLEPVYIGDTLTAEMTVEEVDTGRGWVRLKGRVTNQDGLEVLRADVSGYPGRFEA